MTDLAHWRHCGLDLMRGVTRSGLSSSTSSPASMSRAAMTHLPRSLVSTTV